MIWYKKIGFNSNPFSMKPAAFQPDVVAYDLEYIYDKLESAEILFIEGEYGTGKTTILKSIISKFKEDNKIVYYSFNAGRNFNLLGLLNGANSFLRRFTGLKHRNIILLLDEVHTMTKSQAKEILKYYQNGVLQSVVFVTHDYNCVTLPEDLQLYLEGNVIKTVPLSQNEAIELVENRIREIDLFSKKILKRIFELSDKNPRRFLANCEDIARYAVEMEDYKVSDFHIDSVLEEVIEKKKKQREVLKKVVEPKLVEKIVEEISETKVSDDDQKPKKVSDKKEAEEKDEPKIEIKEVEEPKIDDKPKREKRFKVNKLVEGTKDPLGKIEAADENEVQAEEEPTSTDEIPEYKVFVFEN